MEVFLLISACVLSFFAIILIFLFRTKSNNPFPNLESKLVELQSGLSKIETNCKEDFRTNREEHSTNYRASRLELNETLKSISEQSQNALKDINNTLAEKVSLLSNVIDEANKSNRTEQAKGLKDFVADQSAKYDALKTEHRALADKTIEYLEKITGKVEEKLTVLHEQAKEDNSLLRETLTNTFQGVQESINKNNKENRDTLASNLKEFILEQRSKFDELKLEQKELTTKMVEHLEKITSKVEDRLGVLDAQAKQDGVLMREALATAFKGFEAAFDKSAKASNDLQKEKFELMETKQNELVRGTETKLESIRATVEEKLEKTLTERIGLSFETVSQNLLAVQKGLGEMQTLAGDVGGLKKVLSNVKLRGGVGEVQLALLLEQMLAPNQYDANVQTKKGSADAVEFAIKFPGRSEDEKEFVYLPIDAKFPKDAYEHLIAAYENAVPDDIDAATKNMETTIKKMAKDIRDKYLDPPNTTDFAIMFLPFESIYAEVIRRSSLVDQLRDEFKVMVAGPTTLMAILNSLQMGFRTLALQKRSSEVWGVLGKVKSEFDKFGGMLEKAQKNIQNGLGNLEEVMGTRTRAIQRQLRDVESSPAVEGPEPLLAEILLETTEGL